MAVMLITHRDGGCRRDGATRRGDVCRKSVEELRSGELFARPCHPYTQGLIRSIPRLDRADRKPGSNDLRVVPSLLDPAPGCRFAPRLPLLR